ncbi:MAG: membrane-bound ClpP family serine protease [Planctomycetota bacterium]|jgi:membrane-bound ClpP family serine protease
MTTTIILLFAAGLVLIIAEVFVPSMGLLGLAATLCIAGSIGMAFYENTSAGVNMLIASAVLVPLVMVFGIKLFPSTPMGKKLMVRGYSFADGTSVDPRDKGLTGKTGTVEAPLRPAGIARIDDRRVDVVSRGEMIDRGEPVVVVEVSGNRVIVSRA